ncbi:hypothetical protein ACFYWP_13265 [Actinacidiphila glaucinigra]|uniref:hypothetical protein n=1 Tax=Actinacidiphila glaucinigra TaxID=235986 RepID=UPI003679808C
MPAPTPAPPRRQGRAPWGAGEAALTLGAVLLLLVAHQLWWTNLTPPPRTA